MNLERMGWRTQGLGEVKSVVVAEANVLVRPGKSKLVKLFSIVSSNGNSLDAALQSVTLVE
jgi:hypothetical protein